MRRSVYTIDNAKKSALNRFPARVPDLVTVRAGEMWVVLLQCGIKAVHQLNEQEWMLPCNYPSESSIEKWCRRLLKMSIGYVGYVGYNNKLPYLNG